MTRGSSENQLAWCWVLAAFLVASARLFETGLSLDPAIYATIARNVARHGDWWSLRVGEQFFPQFFEHPFLAFWLQGGIFRLFGANDYTARLLGLVTGSLSFFYLFRLAQVLVDTTFAHAVAFLTLLSAPFIGRMATLYLEIPMTFFLLASLYHGYRSLRAARLSEAVLAGGLLGAAFLTKGLAALPMVGVIGLMALYGDGRRVWRNTSLWALYASAATAVFLFCVLQAHYGSYSFWEKYVATGLFGKAIRPKMSLLDPLNFFIEFVKAHPAHVLVALAFPFALRRHAGTREAAFVGGAGVLLFGLANGLLGKVYYHYLYTLFPFANLLAAVALYPWLVRRPSLPWPRWALFIALGYQVGWNLVPLAARKKPWMDFYQLDAPMAVLRARGIGSMEGIGLAHTDWIYPAMSLWYWEVDTVVLGSGKLPTATVVLTELNARGQDPMRPALESNGYLFCAGSQRYRLWVKTTAMQEACRSATIHPKWIR